MTKLNFGKREMLHTTPREFIALWNAYLEDHGQDTGNRRNGGIDDLP